MIRIIVGNVVVECEQADLAVVLATVNPLPAVTKVPEPVKPSVKPVSEVSEPLALGSKRTDTFKAWNIADQNSNGKVQAWYGHGLVLVDNKPRSAGFYGFLAFLHERNPGRETTYLELQNLFRFMPWAESTVYQNLVVCRHQHGWVYTDGKYVAK